MSKELEALSERVYETAVAFKEAEDDPSAGRHARSARYADYMAALTDHASHFVRHYINNQAKGKP